MDSIKIDLMAFRPKVPEDEAFIYATWLRGLRYGNDTFKHIDAEAYFTIYQQVIKAVLASPRTKVNIACLKEDPSVILGYSVTSPGRLDWVHVKSAWRRIGIMSALITEMPETVTHVTKLGLTILKKYPNVKFNPFGLN